MRSRLNAMIKSSCAKDEKLLSERKEVDWVSRQAKKNMEKTRSAERGDETEKNTAESS